MRKTAIVGAAAALVACPIAGDYYYQVDGGYCPSNGGACLYVTPDGGLDGGPDAGQDARYDACYDAGFDAGLQDAGFDAGPPDAGSDAGCVIVDVNAANIDPRWQLRGLVWDEPPMGSANGSPKTERVFAIGGVPPSGGYSSEVEFENWGLGSTKWSLGGNLATPRAEFAAATIPPYEMVAFGGLDSTGTLGTMEVLDYHQTPDPSATWRQDTPQLVVPRFGQSAVFDGDAGSLMTCGGIGHGVVRNDCEIVRGSFDGGSGYWNWDPRGWQLLDAGMIISRVDFSLVTAPDGLVYAVGGGGPDYIGGGISLPAARTWEVFDGGAWGCASYGLGCFNLLGQYRIGSAAVVAGSRLYVIGGHTSAVDPAGTNTVEYFDFDGGTTWQADAPSLNYARYDLGAVVVGSGSNTTILVFGGINDGCLVGITEEWQPFSGIQQWTPVTPR